MIQIPRVGIGVLIIKNESFLLLGKRKNSHGATTWAPPGGHLEFNESFEQCAKREVFEETGLKITNIVQYGTTNDIFLDSNKHYITIFMLTHTFDNEPQLLEPDKCEGWLWFPIHKLPENLFLPLKNLLQQQKL